MNDSTCALFGWRRLAAAGMAGLTLLLATAAAHARPFVHVVNTGAQSVTAIDSATASVAAVVPVGASPGALAVSADGSRVFVASAGAMSITVLDGNTQAVLRTLALTASPSALAASPDGSRVYAMLAGGVLQALDAATGTPLASLSVGTTGGLGISPDGSRLYVAAGLLHAVDTASLTVSASLSMGADVAAYQVVVSPDGTQAWVTVNQGLFSGAVAVVNTSGLSLAGIVGMGSIPGQIAITPDGSRVYVGVQATWVDTGYGAGFFPGRVVLTIDTASRTIVGAIDLGAAGSNWTQQNTAAGLAVTPDRRTLAIAVPRLSSVVLADVPTHSVRSTLPVAASPGAAAAARTGEAWVPWVVDAVDDSTTATTLGGTALASVLSNDRFGGVTATLAQVSLAQLSSSSPGVSVNPATGAVQVAAGTPTGTYTVVYRLCERASPANCDDAVVTVAVSTPRAIAANDDSVTVYPGASSASVLVNDTLGGAAATTATTRLSALSSSHPGVSLNTSSGAIGVAAGTPPGLQVLSYRLCEATVPVNCDDAVVSVNVVARAIVAGADSGSAPRTGGRAVASVLANDTLAGAAATLSNVSLAAVSTSNAGVTLNAADASVNVAAGTAAGTHSLVYRICERAAPDNCAQATATVTVAPYVVNAVDDAARASSKRAGTALASVLANDSFAGAPATTANVRISLVSITPANPKIKLDTVDGSVDVLGRTQSGTYRIVYQLCEIASPTNCDQATVTLDLSGGV